MGKLTMEVSEFIRAYWKKLRRSGLYWSTQAMVEDSGLSFDDVSMFIEWLNKRNAEDSSLTDEQLTEIFNRDYEIAQLPTGRVIKLKTAEEQQEVQEAGVLARIEAKVDRILARI
jgi:hypothetical protein